MFYGIVYFKYVHQQVAILFLFLLKFSVDKKMQTPFACFHASYTSQLKKDFLVLSPSTQNSSIFLHHSLVFNVLVDFALLNSNLLKVCTIRIATKILSVVEIFCNDCRQLQTSHINAHLLGLINFNS